MTEQARILRFSVLTPDEYNTTVLDRPARASTPRRGMARKLDAKRTATPKAKTAPAQ